MRPFGVGDDAVDPIGGYLMKPDSPPVAIESETMLLLVMLATDAGRTVTDEVIGATVWPTIDEPGPPAAAAVESLRDFFGADSIERLDGGFKLTSRVSIDTNDSGFWLPKPKLGEQPPPSRPTTSIIRTSGWNPILVLPIAVVLLLIVLFLLR